MSTLYSSLIAHNYTLPQSLRDCYEAFREEELQRICGMESNDVIANLLGVLQVFLNDTRVSSFNLTFSLLTNEYENDPPGTVIDLPETLYSLWQRFEHAAELQSTVESDTARLTTICERKSLRRNHILLLADLAAEGFSDTRKFASVADAIRYLAANCGPSVVNYLHRSPALLENRTMRRFRFPDMVKLRVDQIVALGEQFGVRFALPDFQCFTDVEIKMIARDHRALVLTKNSKHFAICQRCQDRIYRFAQQWMRGLEPPPAELLDLPIFKRR
jgi:hypothetical protein